LLSRSPGARRALSVLAALAVALAASLVTAADGSGASAVAAAVAASERPSAGALYESGQSGRYLLGGTWLFRFDDGVGLRERFEDSRSLSGWRAVGVPNAWNAGQHSTAAYAPTVGWYRKDFLLPSSSPRYSWIVRFESVNNTVTIWLNGHDIDTHTGAFLPFEVALPAAAVNLGGVNRLVLRVSDAHSLSGLPPLSRKGPDGVVGGWWNYGGLLREVYLRRVEGIDIQSVQVLPRLGCASCAAEIDYSVLVRSYSAAAQRVALSADYGGERSDLGVQTVAPGAAVTFRGVARVVHPLLWSPGSPHLYDVTLEAVAGAGASAGYFLQSGIRAVSVIGGRLYLNYRPVHLRGVGLVEDSPYNGAALSPAQQLADMRAVKALGATIVRSQYPLSAYEEQLADEMGIMLWSEIPAYQVHDGELGAVTGEAVALVRENILDNGNHPAVVIWSVANELDPLVGAAQTAYIEATVRAAHQLDPTRPVGLAFQGDPDIGCQAGYAPLDVLGINDYFGWYAGTYGEIADQSLLGSYLAKERACYPHQAIMISEFGAEANRSGPVDERGTYQFQSRFVATQLATLDGVGWLSGVIYWALSDFLVRPGWTGGNPYPTPPLFAKGLLSFDGAPKPAWSVVAAGYHATHQIG
jgi:beta-glucuronidase